MKRKLLLILVCLVAIPVINKDAYSFAGNINSSTDNERVKELIKSSPVEFIENKGQMKNMDHQPVPFVLYKASAHGMDVYITERGLTYVFIKPEDEHDAGGKITKRKSVKDEHAHAEWSRVDMTLQGAIIKKENMNVEGTGKFYSNYFFAHCPKGITDVHSFQKITIRNIYPGIDWVLYKSNDKGLKYDFVVHAGADYKQIELVYSSAGHIQINENGDLVLQTKIGTLTENAPQSFLNGNRISSHFVQTQHQKNNNKGYDTHIRFSVPDTTGSSMSDLVIDPQLTWATFFGGENSFDGPMCVATDTSGNLYATGYTGSIDFPTKNAGTYYDGDMIEFDGDAFILKFDNHNSLLWATYYGGTGSDIANAVTTDAFNNVFIAGQTYSSDFPVHDAGTYFQGFNAGNADAFIAKFDILGNLLWSTYYGGTDGEDCHSVVTDASGNAFITGFTGSTNFPVVDAGTFFQGTLAGEIDLFVVKFDNNGNRLWSTYDGGTSEDAGNAVSCDNSGNIVITGYTKSTDFPATNAGTFFQGAFAGGGYDALILKFDNTGNQLWATYYGGTGEEQGNSILADAAGNIFVQGYTGSNDFPLQDAGTFFQATNAGLNDAFILKFDNAGNRKWATFYGGSDAEVGFFFMSYHNLGVDACGNIYVSFETSSADILTKAACDHGFYDSIYDDGFSDIFITQFTNKGNLLWASYLGGEGMDFRCPLTVDKNDNLSISGEWSSGGAFSMENYPLTDPGDDAYYDGTFNGGDDGFIVKFMKNPINTSISVTAGCACNSTATVTAVNTCFSGYRWNTGQTTPTITDLCSGSYTVIISDTTMCRSLTDTIVVNQLPDPVADFTQSPSGTVPPNTLINFTDQSTGSASLAWNFNDPASGSANTSVLPDPAHNYSNEGRYCIQLIASSAEGCTDAISKCIDVTGGALEIPNVFTPNGDHQNDEFYINNLKPGVADLKIYNRWGNLIFSSQGYNNDWNGQGAVDGVYYYVMDYPVDEKIYTGFVQLIKSK